MAFPNGDSLMEPSTNDYDLNFYEKRFKTEPKGFEVSLLSVQPATQWHLENLQPPKVKESPVRNSRIYCVTFYVKWNDSSIMASFLYRVFEDKRLHVNDSLTQYIEREARTVLAYKRRTKNPIKYLATIEI